MCLETVVLTSCQVTMLLLCGNRTLKITAIITQGFILSYKKPRGWQPKWSGSELSGTQGTLNFSFWLLMCHLPHGSLWLLELQPLGLPPANRKEEAAGKKQKSKKP